MVVDANDPNWRPYWPTSSYVYKWTEEDGESANETNNDAIKSISVASTWKNEPKDDLFSVSSAETSKAGNSSPRNLDPELSNAQEGSQRQLKLHYDDIDITSTSSTTFTDEDMSRNRSCTTEASMDYGENSSVSTCSAVAMLYSGSIVSSDVSTKGDSSEGTAADKLRWNVDLVTSEKVTSEKEEESVGTDSKTGSVTDGKSVIKLLETGNVDDGRLPLYERTVSDKRGTFFTRRRILGGLTIIFACVCIAVGISIAVPKKARSRASEDSNRLQQKGGNNVFDVPSMQPLPAEPSPAPSVDELPSVSLDSIPVNSPGTPEKKNTPEPTAEETSRPTTRPTQEPTTSRPVTSTSRPSPSPTMPPTREPSPPPSTLPTSNDPPCGGGKRGSGACPDESNCCSAFGWCGRGSAYCDDG